MSNNAYEAKVKEYMELKELKEELDAEMEAIEQLLKEAMGEEEELFAGAYKVLWTKITSQRFDTSLFKKQNPTLAKDYIKTISSRRFSVVA